MKYMVGKVIAVGVMVVVMCVLVPGLADASEGIEIFCGFGHCCYEDDGVQSQGAGPYDMSVTNQDESLKLRVFSAVGVSYMVQLDEFDGNGDDHVYEGSGSMNRIDPTSLHFSFVDCKKDECSDDDDRIISTPPITRCGNDDEYWFGERHPFRDDTDSTNEKDGLAATAALSIAASQFGFDSHAVSTSWEDQVDVFMSDLLEVVTEVALTRLQRRGEAVFSDLVSETLCNSAPREGNGSEERDEKPGVPLREYFKHTCTLVENIPITSLANSPRDLEVALSKDVIGSVIKTVGNGTNGRFGNYWEEIFSTVLTGIFFDQTPQTAVLSMQAIVNQLVQVALAINLEEELSAPPELNAFNWFSPHVESILSDDKTSGSLCRMQTLGIIATDCAYRLGQDKECNPRRTIEMVQQEFSKLITPVSNFAIRCRREVGNSESSRGNAMEERIWAMTTYYFMMLHQWSSGGQEFQIFDGSGSRHKLVELASFLVDLVAYVEYGGEEDEKADALHQIADALEMYGSQGNIFALVTHVMEEQALRGGSERTRSAMRMLNAFASYVSNYQAGQDPNLTVEESAALREQRKEVITNLMDHAADRYERQEPGRSLVSLGVALGLSANVSDINNSRRGEGRYLGPTLKGGVAYQRNLTDTENFGFHLAFNMLNLGNYLDAALNDDGYQGTWSTALVAGGEIGFLFGGMSTPVLVSLGYEYTPRFVEGSDGEGSTHHHRAGVSISYYMPLWDFN